VYFGYAVAQYPLQILIGRYPAQKVLAITVFMWGLVVLTSESLCTLLSKFFDRVYRSVAMHKLQDRDDQPLRPRDVRGVSFARLVPDDVCTSYSRSMVKC
jgi:hypothetical protein